VIRWMKNSLADHRSPGTTGPLWGATSTQGDPTALDMCSQIETGLGDPPRRDRVDLEISPEGRAYWTESRENLRILCARRADPPQLLVSATRPLRLSLRTGTGVDRDREVSGLFISWTTPSASSTSFAMRSALHDLLLGAPSIWRQS